MTSQKDKSRLEAVALLPCAVCGAQPVEVHHIRTDAQGRHYGLGQRAPHDRTIPLCREHHRTGGFGVAYHAGPREFVARYGSENDLLQKTNDILNRQGLI